MYLENIKKYGRPQIIYYESCRANWHSHQNNQGKIIIQGLQNFWQLSQSALQAYS